MNKEEYFNRFHEGDNITITTDFEDYRDELLAENKALKKSLIEIKEYIKDEIKREAFHYYLDDDDIYELLDILNKALGVDSNE